MHVVVSYYANTLDDLKHLCKKSVGSKRDKGPYLLAFLTALSNFDIDVYTYFAYLAYLFFSFY